MDITVPNPGLPLTSSDMVVEDRQRHLFRVARRAFTDEEVLEQERRQIFNRDRGGAVHAFLNTCPHRGAMVVREKKGNALSFRCFYHGWSFNVNGRFASRFEEGNYGKEHYGGGCADLAQVPRLESYRDFWFVNFDHNAMSLSDYLAGAKEYIDLVADQGEVEMEIVGSGQQYIINANWKLLAENSIDAFHGFPVHSTYFDYLQNIGSLRSDGFNAKGMTSLGNGHAVIEYASPWGRPIARWVPSWGEANRELVERIRQGLIQRFGEERGLRIAETSRNMVIFPNLVINDIMAITVRTFYPDAANRMTVSAWALGARDEDHELRKLRLFNFLEFLGPGGFATPDDQEALENCQRGYRNQREVAWNDISKGMPRVGPPKNDDEEQMRSFWRQWRQRMAGAA